MEEKEITMEIVNPRAAGVDIGSRSHWVAIGQGEKDYREFGVFNEDLHQIAEWFRERMALKQWPWKVLALIGNRFMQS